MDFCPECGSIIMPGKTRCNLCGTDISAFKIFERLDIATPKNFIENSHELRQNYDEFLKLILNKEEVEFSKNEIMQYFNKIIDKANDNFIEDEKNRISADFVENLNSFNNYINDEKKLEFKSKYNKDYFNFYEDLDMENQINEFNEEFINKKKRDILDKLPDEYISHSNKMEYQNVLDVSFDLDPIIEEHNTIFIEKEMKTHQDFFDNIDGKSLDENQRIAVLTDDDNTQIVAGAGTGKTLTIQSKVKYLIEKQGIAPEDILCISFSNSARDDLAEKLRRTIGDEPVEVRTFHSLGYKILGINGTNKEVPQYEIADLIKKFFKESFSNPNFIDEVIEFFSYYYNIVYLNMDNLKLETMKSRFTTLNEYDEYLSEYLQIDNVRKPKEYMTNIKDLIVANYLFMHNIDYQHLKQARFKEKNYNKFISNYFRYLFSSFEEYVPEDLKLDLINKIHKDFACESYSYYPNFYLPDCDIYIELASEEYDWQNNLNEKDKETIAKNLKVREDLNNSFKTKILTIFDYGDDIDSLLDEVHDRLAEYDIKQNKRNYKILYEMLILQEKLPEYKRFIQTVDDFIRLFKGNSINIDYYGNDISKKLFERYLCENGEKYSNSFEKRNDFFLRIIEKIYKLYSQDLVENDYIDFNDMINDAIIELRNGKYIHEYKYVIVDEYQDTSYTRYKLLQEVQNSTGAKVVVVGDDWQSIYGFTGCDVNLFSQFDKYFENPKMVKIDVTRRNSQELIDIAGEFIQENKNQIPKKLKSEKENESPIKIFEYVSKSQEVLALIKILEKISKEKYDAKILILGRNNFDIYDAICKEIFTTMQFKDYTTIKYVNKPDLNIEFRTVHKSKGLEADYVIVLNLNDRINGFPNKIIDDPVLNFVKYKQDENIDYPEERRLFYVALTRTKNDVYLFGKIGKTSKFIDEIRYEEGIEILDYSFSNEEVTYINKLLKKRYEVIETEASCPKCGLGNVNLILNNEKGTSYFRCSNFCGWEGAPYHNKNYDDGTRKIDYVKYVEVCPKNDCEGILIVRRNSYDGSHFLGCSNFPNCDYRKNIRITEESFTNVLFDIVQSGVNTTRYGVYYLDEYIPDDKRKYYNEEELGYSKRLIGFKRDMDDYSVGLFTRDLMEFISFLSNNKFDKNIKLALIAVPSSKVHKIKSPMKKTIDIIEEWYESGDLKSILNCENEILNYKDLLKRVKDVPTAHLGEGRASCDEHIDSIECMQENLSNENIAYLILDDITTTGNSMRACNEILLEHGVDSENIFNIALGATVRDDNEEI